MNEIWASQTFDNRGPGKSNTLPRCPTMDHCRRFIELVPKKFTQGLRPVRQHGAADASKLRVAKKIGCFLRVSLGAHDHVVSKLRECICESGDMAGAVVIERSIIDENDIQGRRIRKLLARPPRLLPTNGVSAADQQSRACVTCADMNVGERRHARALVPSTMSQVVYKGIAGCPLQIGILT